MKVIVVVMTVIITVFMILIYRIYLLCVIITDMCEVFMCIDIHTWIS